MADTTAPDQAPEYAWVILTGNPPQVHVCWYPEAPTVGQEWGCDRCGSTWRYVLVERTATSDQRL